MQMLAPRDFVIDVHVATADEFLDRLSPRSMEWESQPALWVFRGQRDANWKLIPSAMRGSRAEHPFACFGIDVPAHVAVNPDIPNWSLRIRRLNQLLELFAGELDRQGLPVPHSHPTVVRRTVTESMAFPPAEAFPLMALAQHHRLPTLFLDWTKRAWVAAYFAAQDAASYFRATSGLGVLDAAAGPSHLAVWALYRMKDQEQLSGRINFYEAPANTNPNLRAQNGLFLWWNPGEEDRTLDEQVAWLGQQAPAHPGLRPLKRFCLPTAQAGRLLCLLSLEHIDAAALFPGVDGIVRSIGERMLWDVGPAVSPRPSLQV